MSTEQLVEGLGKRLGRRNLLVKLGTGAVGATLGLMGLAPSASAATVRVWCCNLCNGGSGSCGSCVCTWCWACCYGSYLFSCCDCYNYGPNCGGCPARCSYTINRGTGACNP